MTAHNDAVGAILGSFGPWQFRSIFIIFLVKIPAAWFMACLIFTAKNPLPSEIVCAPPTSIQVNTTVQEHWVKSAHVEKVDKDNEEDEKSYDVCKVYGNAEERFQNKTLLSQNVTDCKAFAKVGRPKFQSLIHEFDLLCSREQLLSLTQSSYLAGNFVGGVLGNFLIKTISPKHVMLIGMLSQVCLGVATSYAQNFYLHLILRSSVAATCTMMFVGIFIVTDITHGWYRIAAMCMFEQFWSIGIILLPLIGSWWESWGIVYLAITFPTCILIFMYQWIPDSPRWLLKHGRIEEAKHILIEAARINQREDINEEELDKNLKELSDHLIEDPPEPSLWSLWDVPKDIKVKLIIAHLGWGVYLMLNYELLLHVRVMRRNFVEINTAMAGLSELIGTFIGLTLIFHSTRKWLWGSLLNILTALLAFSAIFVPNNATPFHKMLMYMGVLMLEKMTVSTSLSIFITCTTEIVPKEKRFIANYSGLTWSRFFVIFGPFIGFSAIFGRAYPRTIMAAFNIIIAIFVAIFIKTPKTNAHTHHRHENAPIPTISKLQKKSKYDYHHEINTKPVIPTSRDFRHIEVVDHKTKFYS